MIYSTNLNLFFKSNNNFSNQEKIEKLNKYPVGDMLDLLRNMEESPMEYDVEIIKGLYKCLYDKGIMCM